MTMDIDEEPVDAPMDIDGPRGLKRGRTEYEGDVPPHEGRISRIESMATLLQGSGADAPPAPVVSCPAGPAYILVQTHGAAGNKGTLDEKKGDGAYEKWMMSYFKGAKQLVTSESGNTPNMGQVTKGFKKGLEAIVKAAPGLPVVLNWHVRFTGRPNSYTGRGTGTVSALKSLCEEKRVTIKIVYTVHEFSDSLKKELVAPDALIALNPTVKEQLIDTFPNVPVYLSRVPNLMTSAPMRIVDSIRGYVGEQENPEHRLGLDYAAAHLLKHPSTSTTTIKGKPPQRIKSPGGLLIFGTIDPRHGATTAVVEGLCQKLDRQEGLENLSVTIAGKTVDTGLEKELRGLAEKNTRLDFHGPIGDTLDEVTLSKYAISFDKLGYRDNASAMVNTTRTGVLLFSREKDETNEQLIVRAVDSIAKCEKSQDYYRRQLAAQQPRYAHLAANNVGAELDGIFAEIAKR